MHRLLNVHRYRFRKGGAEAVYLDHLQLFRDQGWTCAEFVMAHPRNGPSEWEGYFPPYYQPAGGFRGLAETPRFLWSREAERRMEHILDEFRPDIIHIHGLYQQLTPSVLGPAAARGLPIVFTTHDFKLLCPAYFLYNKRLGTCERCAGGRVWNSVRHRCLHDSRAISAVYAADALLHRWRGSYEAVSAYVMPSRFMLDKHREHGFPAERLHYIPNFFATTTDDEPTEAGRLNDLRTCFGNYVLFFGRLSQEKGCAHLIEACARTGLSLVLVGEGPEEAVLRSLAQGSASPVHFAGYRTGKELWALVEAALCVALPSVWYENAPKSVLEAQARGKLVVASDIGGLPELVIDGVTGFLAEAGNSASLANALNKVAALASPIRSTIEAEARRRVLTRFTRDRYFAAMTSLYAGLLRRAPHAQPLEAVAFGR